MDRYTSQLTIEILPGSTPYEAFQDACRLSTRLGVRIGFDVNDILVIVQGNSLLFVGETVSETRRGLRELLTTPD